MPKVKDLLVRSELRHNLPINNAQEKAGQEAKLPATLEVHNDRQKENLARDDNRKLPKKTLRDPKYNTI